MAGYLERYDATPDAQKWALARGWIDNEPLPFFKELREQRPVLVTPSCTLIARYDDVIEALNMPKIFTVTLYVPKMNNGLYLMAHDDDALHYREKSIMQGLLNRDDVPRIRTMVSQIAKNLLDAAGGKIEAVNGYCRMVPASLVRDYFGLKGAALTDLMEWSYWNQVDTFYNQPFDLISPDERASITASHDQVNKAMSLYIGKHAALRLVEITAAAPVTFVQKIVYTLRSLLGRKPAMPVDDILSRMLRTSYPVEMEFDIARLAINASGLLIGTVETTSQASAQTIQYLLERPELFAQAQVAAKAADPSAFDSIVWEALRFVPISPYMFRQLSCDYTIGKGKDYATTILKGTNVLTLTQSAMFDPRAYDDPDTFKPGRNWYNHFVFGYGSHECLGKYIGMVLIPEMVRQMLLRPGLKQDGRIDYAGQHLPQKYNLEWAA